MTESEWAKSDSPEAMLRWLGERLGPRKQRLFLCACCRRAWDQLTIYGHKAVEMAELFADGHKSTRQRAAVFGAAG